jgi:hypothetical protein
MVCTVFPDLGRMGLMNALLHSFDTSLYSPTWGVFMMYSLFWKVFLAYFPTWDGFMDMGLLCTYQPFTF